MKNMSMKGKIFLSIFSGLVFTAVMYYVTLPAINLRSTDFWGKLILVIASFAYPFLWKEGTAAAPKKKNTMPTGFQFDFNGKKLNPVVVAIIAVPVAILLA